MVENPNEYDDDQYTRYVVSLISVVSSLWEAGASVENLEDEIANAVEEAVGTRVDVSIIAR